MRVAIFNWSNRLAGGAESYLANVLPALARRGLELGFIHEVDAPSNRAPIPLPPGTPRWCVASLGAAQAVRELGAWNPEVVFGHGSVDPEVEAQVMAAAPGVYFLHSYMGTCISGAKTFKFPKVQPCSRRFGWGCWACFYPRRCGGWNPITAWSLFHQQRQRLRNLRRCVRLVTHSAHMRAEYLKHGFAADQVVAIRFCVPEPPGSVVRPPAGGPASNLLFLGRMDRLKGGGHLVAALPLIRDRLQRPLRLVLAGDGPARGEWKQMAERVSRLCPDCPITFAGWVDQPARDRLFLENDLLVMPSLWPEPFGQVGIEAGFFGLPAVAYDVGGVQAWLHEGVNGHLASGHPPTVRGLAEAIVRSVEPASHHQDLGRGARAMAAQFGVDLHAEALVEVLRAVSAVRQKSGQYSLHPRQP